MRILIQNTLQVQLRLRKTPFGRVAGVWGVRNSVCESDCFMFALFASVERHCQWTWTLGPRGGGRRSTNIWAEAEVAQEQASALQYYCARLRMLCSANTMRISLPFTSLSLSHRDLWPSTVLVQEYVWLWKSPHSAPQPDPRLFLVLTPNTCSRLPRYRPRSTRVLCFADDTISKTSIREKLR